MTIEFHILSGNGALTGTVQERLRAVLGEVASTCARLLPLPNIDVVVMNRPHAVIPRIGVGGHSFDAHHLHLMLDVAHEHLNDNFAAAIQAALAHELHHCARAWARGTSHGETYGAGLVAEGLACCFEEETGAATPFYAVECKGDALRQFAGRAQGFVSIGRGELPGNWNDWMFGRAHTDAEFPYLCGYSTGYALARAWLTATGGTASAAVGVDEFEILAPWLDGSLDPFEPALAAPLPRLDL